MYAKTLFKPTRPDFVNEILKHYHKMKVPNFFVYAKNKTKSQVEDSTDSTMNRIVKEIKDNKLMFNSIKNLESLNYLMLLRNKECNYSNEILDKIYDVENRKYGNNLHIDTDNSNKNNINEISKQVKEKLLAVEPNVYNIIQSLVKHLYEKKCSRKKKLLWYMYGDELLSNLKNNVDSNTEVCQQCGKRIEIGTSVRGKCRQCRDKELRETRGLKTIKCTDCGIEFEIQSMSRVKRCNSCQEFKNKERYIKYNEKRK